MSSYSVQLTSSYLEQFKFRDWLNHRDGRPVTPEERKSKAAWIAGELCRHDRWHVHSHGISRDAAWQELRIKIEHPETNPALHRAIRRLWALLYWSFDTQPLGKIMLTQGYSLFRNSPRTSPGAK
jgi:hypothetical protein